MGGMASSTDAQTTLDAGSNTQIIDFLHSFIIFEHKPSNHMKRILNITLLFCVLALSFSCGPKTDIDKANATIKEYLKPYVSSYKAISSQLDTCYSRISFRQDVMDAAKSVKKYKKQAEKEWDSYAQALSYREIYEPVRSSYQRANWDKHNTEVKESARSYIKSFGKYLDAWQYILDAYDNNDRNQVIGWWCHHTFRTHGQVMLGSFILSPDLSQILAYFPQENNDETQSIYELISNVIEDRDLLPEYKNNLESFKAKNK